MQETAGGTDDILAQAVGDFIARVKPTAVMLPNYRTVDPTSVQHVLLVEARQLSASFLCSDGRLGDRELLAFRRSFGAIEPEVAMGPLYDMRKSDVVTRDTAFIHHASPLFADLLAMDRRDGTTSAWDYYEAALGIAHAVAALADLPGTDCLAAIDVYRTMLLDELKGSELPRPDPAHDEQATSLDQTLEELDDLVGLADVKREVKLIVNMTRVETLRRDNGLPVAEHSRHLVFTGNPGTGKTTVARLLSRIYGFLGVLEKGHLVETDRSGLVSGYVGQTATQVSEVVTSALGGTLFIDEAYALTVESREDFGAEAIATLLKLMEDKREQLVVVAAGYTEPMENFVDSNPGLRSRFAKSIHFPDYSTEELLEIFYGLGEAHEYHAGPDTLTRVRMYLDAQHRDDTFGNARLVRNLFETAVARQASRIVEIAAPTREQLSTLLPEDVPDPGPSS